MEFSLNLNTRRQAEKTRLQRIQYQVAGEILQYNWSTSAGKLNQTSGRSVSWQAPNTPTVASITVKVSNQDKLSTTISVGALVKDTSIASQTPLIWYPFDTGTHNAISDNFNATASGVTKSPDARAVSHPLLTTLPQVKTSFIPLIRIHLISVMR